MLRAGLRGKRLRLSDDTKLLTCGLFQKGRVLAQDARKICGETNVLIASIVAEVTYRCGK